MPILSDADWETHIMPMVIKTDDSDCWFWAGHITQHGYGHVHIYQSSEASYVHRISLERKLGREIDSDCHALHSCFQTPNCVNPDHLREGSRSENQIDRIKDGTSNAKITAEQVIAIRSDKRKQKEIAKQHGISDKTVSAIKSRKIWKHLLESYN